MKTPYRYTVEMGDDPYDFLVYKWAMLGNPEKPESAYKVELYAYDIHNHKCSCEHGIHVKFDGKKIVDCKHVRLVVEAVNTVLNKLQGIISDNVITLKDLSTPDLKLFCDEIRKE